MPKFLFISHRGTTLKPPVFLFKSTVTAQTGAVYWPNRAANRWKPVELSFLVWNLNLAGFFPVIGQTGLVYQNRTAAVSSDRSVKKLWSVTAI